MRVAVVGLGKLGSPLAGILASKGHTVIGADTNPELVAAVNEGRAPVAEPHLQELFDAGAKRLSATTTVSDAADCDVSFIIVPTPSGPDGTFNNKHLLAAVTEIGRGLRGKSDYHVVVITSTVMPGATGGPIRSALERTSGRRVGGNLGLCYNPEFIALGTVIRDMLRPDMVLIGESDDRAGDALEAIYRTICENQPSIRRMNFVNAELTKIAVNTFITTKISYANMLAEICDHVPGADVDTVTAALGCDSRIGAKYLRGATGYGGPCFPRDNVAFSAFAHSIGARADIALATDQINRHQPERLLRLVQNRLDLGAGGATVGILGLAYKPDTAVIEESQGVALAVRLMELGYRVVIFDPLALEAAKAVLGPKVLAASSAEACAAAADLLVIATPWPAFSALAPEALARDGSTGAGRKLIIVDCWRIMPAACAGVAEIVYLGQGEKLDPADTGTSVAPIAVGDAGE